MIILDTDIFTLLQREESKAKATLQARLSQVDPAEIMTTVITYEEQTRGWLDYKARAKPSIEEVGAYAKLKKHLEGYRTITLLDFSVEAASELQRLRRMRIRIGTMDLKIAAITLVHDATLLSRNLVDFKKVPGLKVEDWTS
jgi:tRNA(fMet)-specific endonuclease VapC